MLAQSFACFSKRDASMMAQEKLDAEFLLKQRDLPSQCRLRDIDHAGGAFEASRLCYAQKIGEGAKVHAGLRYQNDIASINNIYFR